MQFCFVEIGFDSASYYAIYVYSSCIISLRIDVPTAFKLCVHLVLCYPLLAPPFMHALQAYQ